MQQGKKVPFSQLAQQQAAEHLQKHDYIKVKIIFHLPDKTLKTLIYKCSSKQKALRLVSSIKVTHKLREHQSLFMYINKKIIDQNRTLAQLRDKFQTDILVIDAATTDIF